MFQKTWYFHISPESTEMSQAISFKSVLLIAGGADGDLEAHLEGKRLFAGRAGRENALPFDCLAARDTYNTNVSAWVKISKQNPLKASKESEENGIVNVVGFTTGGLKLLKDLENVSTIYIVMYRYNDQRTLAHVKEVCDM